MGTKNGQKKKEGEKGEGRPQSKASFGEVWKVASSLSNCGTELAERHFSSMRTAEKGGGNDEVAAGSAGERK